MKRKCFVEEGNITFEDIKAGTANGKLYSAIKDIACKTNLNLGKLDCGNIGKEFFIVPNGCKEVIPALLSGVEFSTDFTYYDPATGEVETFVKYLYRDAKGNILCDGDIVCVLNSYEEAEEIRRERLEDD